MLAGAGPAGEKLHQDVVKFVELDDAFCSAAAAAAVVAHRYDIIFLSLFPLI